MARTPHGPRMAAVPGDAEMRLAIADAAPSRAMHNRGGQCNALESYSYVTHLMWMIGTGHAALDTIYL